ncbi:hypothetical protein PFISCL1PPCAC_20297, partial [Pristionchus fissidentatus]
YEPLGNPNGAPPPPPQADDPDNIYEAIGIGPAGPASIPPPPPPPPPPKKLTQSEKRKVEPIREDDGMDLDSDMESKKKDKKNKKKKEEETTDEDDGNDEPQTEKSCEEKEDSERKPLKKRDPKKEARKKKRKESMGLGCKLFIGIVVALILIVCVTGTYILFKSLSGDDTDSSDSATAGAQQASNGTTADPTTNNTVSPYYDVTGDPVVTVPAIDDGDSDLATVDTTTENMSTPEAPAVNATNGTDLQQPEGVVQPELIGPVPQVVAPVAAIAVQQPDVVQPEQVPEIPSIEIPGIAAEQQENTTDAAKIANVTDSHESDPAADKSGIAANTTKPAAKKIKLPANSTQPVVNKGKTTVNNTKSGVNKTTPAADKNALAADVADDENAAAAESTTATPSADDPNESG